MLKGVLGDAGGNKIACWLMPEKQKQFGPIFLKEYEHFMEQPIQSELLNLSCCKQLH